ncbi:GntR family transcriptional regulator [Cryptosporangium arvum]|uniref:GntR family transcriptional regulator n=1 Tax=Cryptosporangium arvum TaxID=80871 RepID=UPI0004BB4ECF|nr:GntR family transcriptional regulator [Cryptosporangium arvum]
MPPHLHQAIRAQLEARILSGDLGPGAKLPTEAELQAEHRVSRSVAQRVLTDLARDGLVVRRKRLGTHVAEGARQVNLMRSVDPRLDRAGLPGRMSVVSAGVVPAGRARVAVPGVAPDEAVTQLVRVRRDGDGTPLVAEVAALPFRLVPRLLDEELETVSVRAYLADHDVPIARSRMYFDPVLLDDEYAGLLEIEPGPAALRRRRLMWQPDGRIAESAAYYLRPGALEFYVEYTEPEGAP